MSTERGSKLRVLLAIALALLSTSVALLALEAALRMRRGGLFSAPARSWEVRMVGRGYPGSWDPKLGYAPEPGVDGRDNIWGKQVGIDLTGLRSNGRAAPAGPAVLAVGDSFVFGDEVDDHETWPAALERRLGRPVLNGGVFGYGLDQIALRAESLLERFAIETLVVGVIPDDVERCEYSFRFAHKPWFDLQGGSLVLHNVPAPRPEDPLPGDSAAWRLLQRSALLEFAIHRLAPLSRPVRGSVRVHRRGSEVAEALIVRLAEGARNSGHQLLLVVAWHPGARTALLDPVRRRGLELAVPVLDLEPTIRGAIADRAGEWSELFHPVQRDGATVPGHMTAIGNGLVADTIATRLARL